METLLRGLGLDLQARCFAIQRILESTKTDSEIQDYVNEICDKTDQIRQEIDALLNDPDLGNVRLLSNQFFAFSRLTERLSQIEWVPVPAITRYNDADRYLCSLCALLVHQMRYPLRVPLVSGFSNNYYGVSPSFHLISIPAAEQFFLLGLPDLCHELGHILFFHHGNAFLGNFFADLSSHIQHEKQRRITEGAPPGYQILYDRLESEWKDRWTTEFACDLIASFVVGPAFGWTHLRICCGLDPNVFRPAFGEPSSTHPSGEARMRAILAMLKKIGLDDGCRAIQGQWLRYLSTIGGRKPMEYEHCYPDVLIDSLTKEVHDGCVKIGLVSYKDQHASGKDVNFLALLNEAWTVLQNDPQSYAEWESHQVHMLEEYVRTH